MNENDSMETASIDLPQTANHNINKKRDLLEQLLVQNFLREWNEAHQQHTFDTMAIVEVCRQANQTTEVKKTI